MKIKLLFFAGALFAIVGAVKAGPMEEGDGAAAQHHLERALVL